jgi:hypothetical protein
MLLFMIPFGIIRTSMSELKPTEELIFLGITKFFGSWHTETQTQTTRQKLVASILGSITDALSTDSVHHLNFSKQTFLIEGDCWLVLPSFQSLVFYVSSSRKKIEKKRQDCIVESDKKQCTWKTFMRIRIIAMHMKRTAHLLT